MKIDWKNKKVAVLGAGTEGIESIKYLLELGADITVLDQREEVKEEIERLDDKEIKVVTGEHYLDQLDTYEMIVRSPGIKRSIPQLIKAEKEGVKITSHTILFFETCPAPIIGVTGTKGKGTTTALIYEMLKDQGFDAYIGGNIGVPPLRFLHELKPISWVVLELSSFQLEDMQQSPADAPPSLKAMEGHSKALAGKPHIAVILMIVPEHLGKDVKGTQNYHESMEEYVDAKRNILRWQSTEDFAVINRDYIASHESDIHTEGKVFQVSREREATGNGCFVKDETIWIKKYDTLRGVIKTSEILLPGRHNLENVCAAAMAANLAGVSTKSIANVLRRFKGLEHRLELVREFKSVRYYDDSFSTTPETAIAAIEAFDAPEVIILGGSGKGSDFTQLGKILATRPNIRGIIGIGSEWKRMKSQFPISNFQFPITEGLTRMEDVVRNAALIAEPGDVVLLSPACASFDMFKNYKERGEQFKKAVNTL